MMMTPALDMHEFARQSALRIADSLAEGTVIGVFAALLVRAFRRQNAGTRFAVWFSALMAVAAAPFVSGLLAQRTVGVSVPHPAITLPDFWALYVFAAWALIAAWSLIGVIRSLWHLRVLRASCAPVDASTLTPVLRDTLQRGQTPRRTILCLSDEVRVPTVIGLWKPAVVFPRWVIEQLSPADLNQVLLHELAHLRRWDDWTNFAQQLVQALFFFHPVVWWIESRVSLEREIACDDAVIEATKNPHSYAECLAHLAERSFVRRSLALAQAALGKMRQVSTRVEQILDADRTSAPGLRWKTAAVVVSAFAFVCAIFAATGNGLIAFSENGAASGAVAANIPAVNSAARLSHLTDSSSMNGVAPVVPASWKSPAAQALIQHHAILHTRTAVPNNLTAQQTKPGPVRPHAADSNNDPNRLVHLTSLMHDALPSGEAVFVVVHTEEFRADQPGPPMFRIEMWHVVVFQRPVDPDKKPPQKET
jgi:beta-lactamase regulating signal transducer with metallopeptidase domain